MQFYSDESREEETYSLPDDRTAAENKSAGWKDGDGDPMPSGWYYWYCWEAINDARENS